jgi:hypothetical protein
MTQTTNDLDQPVPADDDDDQPPLSAEEIEHLRREYAFAPGERSTPDEFPRLTNLSVGFIKRAIVRPVEPARAEYVTIPMPIRVRSDDNTIRKHLAVAEWNMLWEAGQFKRRFFDEDDLTPDLERIADRGDFNIIFVPRTRSRYYEYAPLFHLLDRRTVEHFGLPLLKAGQWPYTMESFDISEFLPADFEDRLARAWAWKVWPHLNSGSPLRAFSDDEPIKMLAHNLDFWLPAVTDVIQSALREFPVTVGDGELPTEIQLIDGSVLEGAVPGWPRKGGEIWRGKEEAAEFVEWTVEQADQTGRLRAIMDAVKSHRVEDDFSAKWSYAREDFERKLHRKRNKISVRFVELPDTIPVQSPETEVEGKLVTADFMALLNAREREIVVLLNSGFTNLTDIAQELGYANHSPISKKLAKIRKRAEQFFEPN